MYDFRAEIARETFNKLWHETEVRCSRALKRHLVLDRLRGHVERGKGQFEGLNMHNTPLEWFCEALGWDAGTLREESKAYINSVATLAEKAAKTEGEISLCDEQGKALFGIGFLRWISVDSKELLTGLYLGGYRDDPSVRAKVDSIYGDKLGANGHHTHSSDDGAIVAGGMMFGFGCACGVWLADAIDSMEKTLPDHGNADLILARKMRDSGAPNLATPEDLYSLTYLCTIPENLRGVLPDCSLREMLTIDPLTDQSALESHLLAAAGKPYATMPMPDGQMSNRDFYHWVQQRVDEERK